MKACIFAVYHPRKERMKGTEGMVMSGAESIVVAFELVPMHLVRAMSQPSALMCNHD
ncbi:MAG: hypothetical protein KIT40_01760 [Nitrospira sp.]|nr:hypothetical protein [Nitrospira sp.]